MLVDGKNGKLHLLCYLLHRIAVDAAQNEGAAALRREGIENGLKVAQLIAGVKRLFGRMIDQQHIQFGNQFKSNDLFAPCFVDQQIAGDLEQKCLAAVDAMNIATGIGTGHAFGDYVIHVATARHDATKAGTQSTFIRQYGRLEPIQSCPDCCCVHLMPPALAFPFVT